MRVLAISAHPDDETLGAGGMLLKHRHDGDSINWLIVTRAHSPRWSREKIDAKEAEIKAVGSRYGMKKVIRLGFPSGYLDTVPKMELIESIAGVIFQIRPECVYVVHHGDIHTDHQAVHTATLSVLKPFHMRRYGVRRLLSYETLSSTDAIPPDKDRTFTPNVFCDITRYLNSKLKVMKTYKTEKQARFFPRDLSSIRALARYRGASIGVQYAEAFSLLRETL